MPRKTQQFYMLSRKFPTRPSREFSDWRGIEIPCSPECGDNSRQLRRLSNLFPRGRDRKKTMGRIKGIVNKWTSIF
jgi:hypothetical protein